MNDTVRTLDKLDTLGQKIKYLREAKGLNWYQLAKAVGKGQGYIKRIETGDIVSPGIEILTKLAIVLDTTVDYLAGTSETPTSSSPKPNLENKLSNLREQFDEIQELIKKTTVIELPDLGYVPAGLPLNVDQQVGETVLIPVELLEGYDRSRLFIAHASGDSLLEDGINNGDLLIILKDPPFIEGNLYILNIPGNGSTVKYLFRTPDGKARLVPANHHFEEMIFEEVQIVGQVLLAYRPPTRIKPRKL